MKTILFILTLSWLAISTMSCGEKNAATLDYNQLAFDRQNIFIFSWKGGEYEFPDNSRPLPLTQRDLFVIGSLLDDAIDSFNHNMSPGFFELYQKEVPIDSFIIHKEKFRFQYFPFEDVNGKRIVTVVGCPRHFALWQTKNYRTPGLHNFMKGLGLYVNLSTGTQGIISVVD